MKKAFLFKLFHQEHSNDTELSLYSFKDRISFLLDSDQLFSFLGLNPIRIDCPCPYMEAFPGSNLYR